MSTEPTRTDETPGCVDLIEAVSAEVHAAWMRAKHAQGVTSRRSETGEELMVPYALLSEPAKELDRQSVLAVLTVALPLLHRRNVSGDVVTAGVHAIHDVWEYDPENAEAQVAAVLAAAAPASERFWRDRIADELDAYAAQRKGDGSWRNGSNAAERREGAIAGIYEAKGVARGSS